LHLHWPLMSQQMADIISNTCCILRQHLCFTNKLHTVYKLIAKYETTLAWKHAVSAWFKVSLHSSRYG